MKFKFIILLIFTVTDSYAQYPIYKNGYLNINGHQYGLSNGSDTIGKFYTDRFKLFKPIVLPGYATGSEPAIPNSLAFHSDSTTNALFYIDGSGGVHNFGSIGGSGGGGGTNPFADNTALVKNNADNTKLLLLSAASISTGTTRTWTFPDVNGTVARNDAAQTFSGVQTFGTKIIGAAATTSNASVNIPSSAATNPTSPNSGDIWWNGTNLNFYNGSATKDLLAGTNAWKQGGNAFGAVGVLGTTDNNRMDFYANNAIVFSVFPGGNVLFGSSGTSPSQKVYFTGTSRFDGSITIGANSGLSVLAGSNFTSLAANDASNNTGFYWGMNNNFNNAGTNKDFFAIAGTTNYTGGTGETVTQIDIIPAINNTSGTGHSFVGINFNPTNTSLTGTSVIAFKNVSGDNNFNTTSGKTSFGGLVNFAASTTSTASYNIPSGSLVTAITAGNIENNNAFYVTSNALNRTGIGGPIADFTTDAGNTGSAETDLYTYTTKASTLAATGEKLKARFSGNVVGSATASRVINIYFGGTQLFTTGSITVSSAANFDANVNIIRTGTTTARAICNVTIDGVSLSSPITETDLTGLTFTNTNILKITGTSSGTGSATNDIVAKLGDIFWWPSSNN